MTKHRKLTLQVLVISIILLSGSISSDAKTSPEDKQKVWPVLKHYDQDHLSRLAMPLGGIGTGTISLMGNGALRHWEIMNRPAKGFHGTPPGNRAPFFVIFMQQENQPAVTRALMGPVEFYEYESMDGTGADNHGLPRFRQVSFDAAYPLGQVHFSDEDLPVSVTLQAFNPLIPGNADDSGIPIAVLRYIISNKTGTSLKVSVCGSFENFIGADGSKFEQDWKGILLPKGANSNKNEYRKENDFQGIYMYSAGVDSTAEQWGTIALATPTGPDITYRTSLEQGGWGNDILDFWDDFSTDGLLTEKPFTGGDTPRASLAASIKIAPGQSGTLVYFITWHFPNRFAWSPESVGNYYTTCYKDAWDVLDQTLPRLAELEQTTVEFVEAFCKSDYPPAVKEAALFNLSTLRTQTCFRTADGNFFGWEGCNDKSGCCKGSCTHVWNYEQATAFLFADLARNMREIEFDYATNPNGLMSFRVGLPLSNARSSAVAAADGQLGTIMKMYREWQLSGDDDQLKHLWPNVKLALKFCWVEGGWDGDIDGVMEGCQHNTMDVEYYGPNPQMQFWYLGALRAAQEMAGYLGEAEFAGICQALYKNGRNWVDENLFNGEYYEHQILLPEDPSAIAPGLSAGMGASDYTDPDYQLAKGCLVDQLVGQYMAHICGLGYLASPDNIKKTLQSILKYNNRPSVHSHFNNMRSFVLGDEPALLMASYPFDRPKNPFPYFNEVMTGFEYTAAIGMIYEGMVKEGLQCISRIRDRYDGRKRSPFDEAECGHHYARAMASWAAVLALSGFNYSAVEKQLAFNAAEGNYFWSNGSAYGMVFLQKQEEMYTVRLKVLHGSLAIKRFKLNGYGWQEWTEPRQISPGQDLAISIEKQNVQNVNSGNPVQSFSINDIPKPPFIRDENGNKLRIVSFNESLFVRVEASADREEIRYTLNGVEPDQSSMIYNKPLQITENTILKAASFLNGMRSLRSSTAKFFKFNNVKGLELSSAPHPKYQSNGLATLVDGRRGGTNYTDGKWLGFEEIDMLATIDLGEVKMVHQVLVGCLNDPRHRIFLPVNITVSTSEDGLRFLKTGEMKREDIVKIYGAIDFTDYGQIGSYDLKVSLKGIKSRFIRLKLENPAQCPPGHPKAGGKAWLFVDEIITE